MLSFSATSAVWGAIALIAVAPLAGCAPDSDDNGVTSALSSIPERATPGILDALRGVRAGQQFPEYAVDVLTARCMKSVAAPFEPLPQERYSPPPIPQPYGLTVAEATSAGYWNPSYAAPDDGFQKYPEAVQQKITLALYGADDGPLITLRDPMVGGSSSHPASGCLAEGRQAVFGDLRTWAENTTFMSNFASTILRLASADPQIRELDQAWSNCMERAGRPNLDSPEKAEASALRSLPPAPRKSDFRSTVPLAVIDATCQAEVAYAAQRENLEDRYFTAAMAQYEGQLTAVRLMYQTARNRAQQALLRRS